LKLKTTLSVIVLISILLTGVFAEQLFPNTAPVTVSSATAEPYFGVTFSHRAGFYSESFELVLTAATEDVSIYYTLDGTPPTAESTLYTAPIPVNAPPPAPALGGFDSEAVSRVSTVAVRAVAVARDGKVSGVYTRNFVSGTDVFERFGEDVLVFALTADPYDLYDHEHGILVEGIDREQWIAEFTRERGRPPRPGASWENNGEIPPDTPANFNRKGRESERDVHVQLFDSSGTLHISQRAGVRVKGGYSRAHAQKSLELYAREEYGANADEVSRNNFLFNFFGEEHTSDGQLINRYRRVRLRNGGSDREAGMIRDELSQDLFRQAGQPDTQLHTPAAVFLNGEYYGAAWLKSPRTDNHIARKYGGNSDNVEFVEGGDARLWDWWWFGERRAVNDINQVFDLARRGFTGEAGQTRFEEFCLRVDLDNLVRYYAMQIYTNNEDWPNHNMELWRYFPTSAELANPELHEYLRDGRWRVFPHDLEAGWAVWDDNNRMARTDTLRNLMVGNVRSHFNGMGSSTILHSLLQRDDMKAKFANTFVDLMEGAFSPANIERTLNELISRIQPEHNVALRMNIYRPDSVGWPSIDSVAESRAAIRRFVQLRPATMYTSINTNLGFAQNRRFAVALTTGENGGAVMHSRTVGEASTVTGNYFTGTEIAITAKPNPGYVTDYWTVNGVRREGESVRVTAASTVRVSFKKCAEFAVSGAESLYISAVKASGADWIEIRNDTDRAISTKGMYLSDSGGDLFKWAMPALIVKPNDSIIIACRNNTATPILKRSRTSFNLAFGERVRLSDPRGNVVSVAEVSRMTRTQVQRRGSDGKYRIEEISE
jgi:hypothetical protein